MCPSHASRPFGGCLLCKPVGLPQTFDASVFSLGLVRGRELLVAESLVIRYVVVHSRLVRTTLWVRLFKIDHRAGGLVSRAAERSAESYAL